MGEQTSFGIKCDFSDLKCLFDKIKTVLVLLDNLLTPIDLYFSVQLYIDSAIGFQNTLQAPGSSRLGVQPGIEELCGEELDGGVPVC